MGQLVDLFARGFESGLQEEERQSVQELRNKQMESLQAELSQRNYTPSPEEMDSLLIMGDIESTQEQRSKAMHGLYASPKAFQYGMEFWGQARDLQTKQLLRKEEMALALENARTLAQEASERSQTADTASIDEYSDILIASMMPPEQVDQIIGRIAERTGGGESFRISVEEANKNAERFAKLRNPVVKDTALDKPMTFGEIKDDVTARVYSAIGTTWGNIIDPLDKRGQSLTKKNEKWQQAIETAIYEFARDKSGSSYNSLEMREFVDNYLERWLGMEKIEKPTADKIRKLLSAGPPISARRAQPGGMGSGGQPQQQYQGGQPQQQQQYPSSSTRGSGRAGASGLGGSGGSAAPAPSSRAEMVGNANSTLADLQQRGPDQAWDSSGGVASTSYPPTDPIRDSVYMLSEQMGKVEVANNVRLQLIKQGQYTAENKQKMLDYLDDAYGDIVADEPPGTTTGTTPGTTTGTTPGTTTGAPPRASGPTVSKRDKQKESLQKANLMDFAPSADTERSSVRAGLEKILSNVSGGVQKGIEKGYAKGTRNFEEQMTKKQAARAAKASKPRPSWSASQQYFENREAPTPPHIVLKRAWEALGERDKERIQKLQDLPAKQNAIDAKRKKLKMQQAAEDSMKAAVEKVTQRAIKEEEVKAIRDMVRKIAGPDKLWEDLDKASKRGGK